MNFLSRAFDAGVPDPAVIWLRGETKRGVTKILGHRYAALRIKYWGRGRRTAWILEEIGKYQPITVGYVVNDGRIEHVKVLIYRESIGWEVRYPFFTDQFRGRYLTPDHRLDDAIDNISGATLSVNALRRLGRLALFLHAQTRFASD